MEAAGARSKEEEAQAQVDIWKYAFGFAELAVVKCAVDLGIADIVESHNGCAVTLVDLSSALQCSSSSLHRIMRFLTHCHIFKEVKIDDQDSAVGYIQTPLSRLLMKNEMASLVKFSCSPEVSASFLSLGDHLLKNGDSLSAFEVAHGMSIWEYFIENPTFNEVFNKGMACQANFIISTVIANYRNAFEGISCLVDVGGGNGMTLRELVKACPWITRAINFDLPHVVSSLDSDDCIKHIGGDMFVNVPSADAAFIMNVLHNWDDDACIKILKCKEAIPIATGKVIIVEVVLDKDNHESNRYKGVHFIWDTAMMAHTSMGKQRTSAEWAYVFNAAGFTEHTIKNISGPKAVIEVYP